MTETEAAYIARLQEQLAEAQRVAAERDELPHDAMAELIAERDDLREELLQTRHERDELRADREAVWDRLEETLALLTARRQELDAARRWARAWKQSARMFRKDAFGLIDRLARLIPVRVRRPPKN